MGLLYPPVAPPHCVVGQEGDDGFMRCQLPTLHKALNCFVPILRLKVSKIRVISSLGFPKQYTWEEVLKQLGFFTNKALDNTVYLGIAYKYTVAWRVQKHVLLFKVQPRCDSG